MGKKAIIPPEVATDNFEVQQMKKRIAELEKQLKEANHKLFSLVS